MRTAPDQRRADLERVVRTVVEPVRRYLHRRTDAATADDVLGETLVVLWRRLDDVPADPVPWAIGIARLQLANAERGRHRRGRLALRFGRTEATAVPDPTEPVAGRLDDVAVVRAALGRLRPADAELLRLITWDELTTGQVAELLGITTNAVAIRLHRARGRLREELGRPGARPDTGQRGEGTP